MLGRAIGTLCLLVFVAIPCRPALSAEWLDALGRAVHEPFERVLHDRHPHTPQDTAMECLGSEIDWLEHHIDAYGTVVAKQPNIWGEARLTKHRDEYERQMLTQLHEFQIRMNAALRRSDMAYLGLAFALQQGFTAEQPAGVANSVTDTKNIFSNVVKMAPDPTSAPGEVVTSIEPTRPLEIGGPTTSNRAFQFETGTELSLEPVIGLDQLSRYLNHLHELRRLNEGDDTADSPGYSLNLVRIPVSVLPGKKTRKGYGAEITITATPYLCDALLPTTFRTLVINDLVDQLALPIARFLNHHDAAATRKTLEEYANVHNKLDNQRKQKDAALVAVQRLRALLAEQRKQRESVVAKIDEMETPTPQDVRRIVIEELGPATSAPLLSILDRSLKDPQAARIVLADDTDDPRIARLAPARADELDVKAQLKILTVNVLNPREDETEAEVERTERQIAELEEQIRQGDVEIQSLLAQLDVIEVPPQGFSRARTSLLPLPPSQLLEVYSKDLFLHLAADLRRAFQSDPVNSALVHLMDIEAALQSELAAAYELLSRSNAYPASWATVAEPSVNPPIWSLADQHLVEAIRTRNGDQIKSVRERFLVEIECLGANPHSSAAALAWAVIVESALLNDRLIQDMRETAAAKGCPCWADAAVSFVGPFPDPPARQAFNEYVRCRWPIHVFALDPVTQDQNIGDEFGRRRELQLALSMAFATGEVNAQTMMRFARRLEWDMATIALNRTVVGFSHGSDTFGWRFYPRFQTPPIEGNLAAFGQTLFGGPTRDQDMNKRELETGIRECTAIVLMPGFVPNCTIDVRSNWFRLTNPKQTEISMEQTMELSRVITAMRWSAAECSRGAHLYRPEELANMLKRVDQLDRELPLQTMLVPMPYENTLGGFEMFNTGITDLAPELRGWYGAPGLHPNEPTTLYLVGDHFSVHDTRVIAGAQALQYRMISRQLLEVHFPAGMRLLNALHRDQYFDAFVDAHVATPYGVSSHLLIPVVRDDSLLGAGRPRWLPQTIRLTYSVTETGGERAAAIDALYPLPSTPLAIAFPVQAYPQATLNVTCAMSAGNAHLGTLAITGTELDARRGVYVVPPAALKGAIDGVKAKLESYLTYRLRRNEPLAEPFVVHVTGTFDRAAPAPQTEILGEFQIELRPIK